MVRTVGIYRTDTHTERTPHRRTQTRTHRHELHVSILPTRTARWGHPKRRLHEVRPTHAAVGRRCLDGVFRPRRLRARLVDLLRVLYLPRPVHSHLACRGQSTPNRLAVQRIASCRKPTMPQIGPKRHNGSMSRRTMTPHRARTQRCRAAHSVQPPPVPRCGETGATHRRERAAAEHVPEDEILTTATTERHDAFVYCERYAVCVRGNHGALVRTD